MTTNSTEYQREYMRKYRQKTLQDSVKNDVKNVKIIKYIKKINRSSIRGIKAFLGIPEDHAKNSTKFTEARDVITFLTRWIKENEGTI